MIIETGAQVGLIAILSIFILILACICIGIVVQAFKVARDPKKHKKCMSLIDDDCYE